MTDLHYLTAAEALRVHPGLMSGAPPFGAQSQVTLANWQDPPFNRWAFQHVRELIPTARIRARYRAGMAAGSGPEGYRRNPVPK